MRDSSSPMTSVKSTLWLSAVCSLILLLSTCVVFAEQARPPRRPTPSRGLLHRLGLEAPVNAATATALAAAMGVPSTDLAAADLGTSDPNGVGVGTVPLGRFFPTQGSTFAILSTGLASDAATPNTSPSLSTTLAGLNNSQGNDMVRLKLTLKPPAGAQCLAFDFAFFSEEFPEFVGTEFNDVFLAELRSSNFTIVGSDVVAPNNFAVDVAGNLISVNTVFGVTANTQTTYDGATPLLRAVAKLQPSDFPQVDLFLSIMDLGDSIYDSAVFLDNFAWQFNADCASGAGLADRIISPQSGFITRNGTFDLVVFAPPPVVGASATLNGVDVTGPLSACILGTRVDGKGHTLRCPGLSGALLQAVFGPGPYVLTVTLHFNDGSSATESATWEIPGTSPPALAVSPGSTFYASTQHWDLVVIVGISGSGIASASATFDNTDVTGIVVSCINQNPTEILGGGAAFAVRCPVSGAQFSPGPHVLAISVQFGDGTSAFESVTWHTRAITEP